MLRDLGDAIEVVWLAVRMTVPLPESHFYAVLSKISTAKGLVWLAVQTTVRLPRSRLHSQISCVLREVAQIAAHLSRSAAVLQRGPDRIVEVCLHGARALSIVAPPGGKV